MIHLYKTLAFLFIASLTACVSTPSSMMANNDEDQDIGLGGTGMLASSGNGLGGTGIVGKITGFGSIFVNGIEVEYDRKTPFTINGNPAAYQQLAIGDVVEVLTTNNQQHTDAQIINVRHEVIGEVESVNPLTHSFTVQGQTVTPTQESSELPAIGDRVAISGFRISDSHIQATRIFPAGNMPALLRTHMALPFNQQTTRWLIQTQVKNNQLKVHFNKSEQLISLPPKSTLSTKQSDIKILQLKKSSATQVTLDRLINSAELPRGRSIEKPLREPNNNMQRSRPMNIMNGPQNMQHRGGR